MWFETLPSFSVIAVALVLPNLFIYATNRIFYGNPYKRYVTHGETSHYYLRDMRISGKDDPYVQVGLESLFPEEEQEKK